MVFGHRHRGGYYGSRYKPISPWIGLAFAIGVPLLIVGAILFFAWLWE